MPELRLSEHYTSVQGEGPRVGIPTQFVRFAGCNMRCPLWPCDTQHAIEPALYRQDSKFVTPYELFEIINNDSANNICLTGGEPFLQNNDKLEELCDLLVTHDFTIECFSNGSFLYPKWAHEQIDFILDWKLAGSGEATTNLETRADNVACLDEGDALKFTVASMDDLDQAMQQYYALLKHGSLSKDVQVYVGAVWGKISNEDIVNYILAHHLLWKLTVQVHKYVWEPDARRT